MSSATVAEPVPLLNTTHPMSARFRDASTWADLMNSRSWHIARGESHWFESAVRRKAQHVTTMHVAHTLEKHSGCVNVVNWNESGDTLISGSDDCELALWRYGNDGVRLLRSVRTGHRRNIFTAHVLPQDEQQTVSGGMDQQVRLCHVERGTNQLLFEARDLVSKIHFVPWQRDVFYTCAYDGLVRLTDLRLSGAQRTRSLFAMRDVGCSERASSAIAFDPIDARQFVLAGGDHLLRVFDVRRVDDARHVYSLSSDADLTTLQRPVLSAVTASGVDWSATGLIAATYHGRPALLFDVRRGRTRALLDSAAEARRVAALSNTDNRNAAASVDDAALPSTSARAQQHKKIKLTRSAGNSPLGASAVSSSGQSESTNDEEDDSHSGNDGAELDEDAELDEGAFDDEDDHDEEDEDDEIDAEVVSDGEAPAPPSLVPTLQPLRARLTGHDNRQTFLKEIAFFNDDYVMTGSDCGNLFMWHVGTTDGTPVNVVQADDSVVNGVSPHPYLPVVATCGIDSTAKILTGGSIVTADEAVIRQRASSNLTQIERSRQMEARFFRFYASGLFELLHRNDDEDD